MLRSGGGDVDPVARSARVRLARAGKRSERAHAAQAGYDGVAYTFFGESGVAELSHLVCFEYPLRTFQDAGGLTKPYVSQTRSIASMHLARLAGSIITRVTSPHARGTRNACAKLTTKFRQMCDEGTRF